MTGIYHVYAWYIPEMFNNVVWLIYKCKVNDETDVKSQNLHVQITTKAGNIISSLKMHFYSAWISDRYIPGIYQAYTRYIHIISLLLPSCGPSWSPKRPWMSRTWTFCWSFPFWLLKVLQLKAGACQSSTTNIWSHKHGCPCVMQVLDRQHTQILRPAFVVQRTYTE